MDPVVLAFLFGGLSALSLPLGAALGLWLMPKTRNALVVSTPGESVAVADVEPPEITVVPVWTDWSVAARASWQQKVTPMSTSANSAVLIFTLRLPFADPSVDLRFAIMLITPVSAFPRHKKTCTEGQAGGIRIGYPLRQPV